MSILSSDWLEHSIYMHHDALHRELQHLSKMLAFPGLGMGLGDPPNRAYSHSDVSATCEVNTYPEVERHHVATAKFRSDVCLERDHSVDTNNSNSVVNSEIRITENSLQRSSGKTFYIFSPRKYFS